jgi:tight adherence protein C
MVALALVFGIPVLFVAFLLLVDAATVAGRQRRESIARATTYGGPALHRGPDRPGPGDRVLAPLGKRLEAGVLRYSPKGLVASVEKRLRKAGLRRLPAAAFVGLKLAAGIAGASIGILLGSGASNPLAVFLFGLMFGASLFILPDRLLAARVKSRTERIQADLPDALDLLAVSVEAGMGFDAALAVLIDHLDGPLADELALTLGEIRAGENRAQALRHLSERVDVPEVTAFTRAITQSDQLGISLGRILHLQARDSRISRQAAAEEKANKLPVKMLFPTLIFIFPPLFLVVLGPAFITILHTL